MSITASSAQLAAQPVQASPQSSTVTATGLLISGASIGPSVVQQATADEILFVSQPQGTLSGDCTVTVQVSHNGSNYGIMKTFANADVVKQPGHSEVLKIGVGNYFRVQFVAGTTTGGGNGVNVRFRN